MPDPKAVQNLGQAINQLDNVLAETASAAKASAPQAAQGRRNPAAGAALPLAATSQSTAAAQGATARSQLAAAATPPAQPVVDSRDFELITRFAAGALILGLEELVRRAGKWDEQAPKDISPLAGGKSLEDSGYGDLARYMLLGMVTTGRRSAVKFAQVALRTPGGLAASLLRTTDRMTGSIFLRPLQRPISDAIRRANQMSREWIDLGWQEEQISRYIASNGIPEIITDVIDMIADNPQLAQLVRDQLSAQSIGIASSVTDTSRKLSAVGDDVAESIVRRLLRRGTRVEMNKIEPVDELPDFLKTPNSTKGPAQNGE